MVTPNLIKLAPTLSIEERYKIVIPDALRMMVGEKSLLSDSEVTALTSFEKNVVWEQYALRVGMFKWAHILWIRDINSEKFCACTCILLLNHQLWQVIQEVGDGATKEAREKGLASLSGYVATLQEKLADFYAYRDALIRLKEELYDVPIFAGETETTIQGFYQFVGEMVERHNDTIRELCTNKTIKRHFKAIAENIDLYLVKEPKPDEAAIAALVDEVRSFAESDVRARLGK